MVITSHQILITFLLPVAFSIILLAFSIVVKRCFCVNSVKITGLVKHEPSLHAVYCARRFTALLGSGMRFVALGVKPLMNQRL